MIQIVDTIIDSGNLLLSVVNDLLMFTQMESGQLSLEEEEFDLISTLEKVLVYSQKHGAQVSNLYCSSL